jgi:hypothetical protein
MTGFRRSNSSSRAGDTAGTQTAGTVLAGIGVVIEPALDLVGAAVKAGADGATNAWKNAGNCVEIGEKIVANFDATAEKIDAKSGGTTDVKGRGSN